MANKNKLRLHCCGGAGTNIGMYISENVIVDDETASIEFHYLDASKDLDVKDVNGTKHRVVSKQIRTKEVHGSGGNRKTNIDQIKESIGEYADKLTKDSRAIDIIISSGSGGSGSGMSGVLAKELMARGHVIFVIVVNDASNDVYVENSLASLATLYSLTKVSKKNIVVSDFINGEVKGKSYLDSIIMINQKIANTIEYLSFMFSDAHEDIDTQDIITMFNTSGYKNMPAGLLFLHFHQGDVGGTHVLSRTIIDVGTFKNSTTLPSTIHDKIGKVSASMLQHFKEVSDTGNITMVLTNNQLNGKFTYLSDIATARKNVVRHSDAEIPDLDKFLDIDL